MKECAVWVVFEAVVQLVFPDDAASGIQVDETKHICVLGGVLDDSQGTLQARVGPLVRLGVCIVDTGKGSKENFIRGRRDGGLDLVLLFLVERRLGWHGRKSQALSAGAEREE